MTGANPITDQVRATPGHENFARTDADLLAWVVEHARPRRHETPKPRWAVVMGLLGVGSSSAAALCRACGLNPEDTLSGAA